MRRSRRKKNQRQRSVVSAAIEDEKKVAQINYLLFVKQGGGGHKTTVKETMIPSGEKEKQKRNRGSPYFPSRTCSHTHTCARAHTHTFKESFLHPVNFTNILQSAFTHADPKKCKKTVRLSSFFALLGSACVKAACRMLVKLTQGEQSVE